jgi:IclR family pca regulon transcriptional regulator
LETSTESRGGGSLPSPTGGAHGIQSVARALGILELFDESRPSLTTKEIASLVRLNRATAYRFCRTLLDLGYLEETAAGHFRPGLKAVSLAQAALSSRELPDLALPYLRALHNETGETVNLALLDGADVVYVARLLSEDLLALRIFVGSRLPAYASSLGRSMLALLADDDVQRILGSRQLGRFTPQTITDRRLLLRELRKVRKQGYAVNDQELVSGIRGIAAAIVGASGTPVAAVNVSLAQSTETMKEVEARLAPSIVRTAQSITQLATRLAVEVPAAAPFPRTSTGP